MGILNIDIFLNYQTFYSTLEHLALRNDGFEAVKKETSLAERIADSTISIVSFQRKTHDFSQMIYSLDLFASFWVKPKTKTLSRQRIFKNQPTVSIQTALKD